MNTAIHDIYQRWPRPVSLLLALTIVLGLYAKTNNKPNDTIADLYQSLSRTSSPRDSVAILYNILDLSKGKEKINTAQLIYNVATRASMQDTRLDMLVTMARDAIGDSLTQAHIVYLAENMPQSRKQQEVAALTNITFNTTLLKDTTYLSNNQQANLLKDVFLEYNHMTPVQRFTPYGASLLYTICYYLYAKAPGAMLKDKLIELENIMDKIATPNGPLIETFLDFAAMAYATMGDFKSTSRLAWSNLALLDNKIARLKTDNRPYLNLEYNYYTLYRRLMSTYKFLTPEEVEQIYLNIIYLAKHNAEVAHNLDITARPHIYYMMFKGKYRQALELIEKTFYESGNLSRQYVLIKLWIEAAEHVGDIEHIIKAHRQYNAMLKHNLAKTEEASLQEIQVMYDSNTLNTSIADIESDNRAIEENTRQTQTYWTIIGGIAMVLTIIIMYISYIRTRWLTTSLAHTNQELKKERDSLAETHKALIAARERAKITDRKKTEFIHTISHEISQPTNAIIYSSQFINESIDGQRRKYLDKFIKIVEYNGYLLHSLINDVLDSAEAENNLIKLRISEFPLRETIDNAVYHIRPALNDSTNLIIEQAPDSDEATIKSDQRRFEQILINIIGNAAKFTPSGTIHIIYSVNKAASTATVSVSDTGCGIPPGNEKTIFERFTKLNTSTQGLGLGLYVSARIADKLGASITVDTDYNDGARFIITIPIQ